MHVLDMLAAGAEERSHTVRSGNQLWSSFGKYQSYEIICCKIWYRNEFSVHHEVFFGLTTQFGVLASPHQRPDLLSTKLVVNKRSAGVTNLSLPGKRMAIQSKWKAAKRGSRCSSARSWWKLRRVLEADQYINEVSVPHVLMCKQFFLSAYYTRLQQFIQVKGRDLTLRQFLQQSQNPSCDTWSTYQFWLALIHFSSELYL